jgi:hypothetical protein
MLKKIFFLIIFSLCFNFLEAKALNDSIKNSHRNQFEAGINFSYYFDRYGCPIRMDHSYESYDYATRPYNALLD